MHKIAHRGASAHFPENTLLAFTKALEMGASAIECDVHRCASGEAVVIHDHTLARTTGTPGYVARRTLKELKTLNAGHGEKIPTLAEVIETIAPRAAVFIEVKAKAAIPEVGRLVERYGKRLGYDRVPVISFHFDWLVALKSRHPRAFVGITTAKNPLPMRLISRAREAGMHSINPDIRYLTRGFVEEAHRANLAVITWTANRPAQIRKAKAFGVDGVMSDDPQRLGVPDLA